jgi:hypothetical protein
MISWRATWIPGRLRSVTIEGSRQRAELDFAPFQAALIALAQGQRAGHASVIPVELPDCIRGLIFAVMGENPCWHALWAISDKSTIDIPGCY